MMGACHRWAIKMRTGEPLSISFKHVGCYRSVFNLKPNQTDVV